MTYKVENLESPTASKRTRPLGVKPPLPETNELATHLACPTHTLFLPTFSQHEEEGTLKAGTIFRRWALSLFPVSPTLRP